MTTCCEGQSGRYHVGDFRHGGTLGHADTASDAARLATQGDRCPAVYVFDRETGQHAWPYHPKIARPAWWPAEG